MAKITANEAVDFSLLDLHWYERSFYDADFLEDSFQTMAGYTYRDVVYVSAFDGLVDRTLLVGGRNFVFDSNGALIGGTVTGLGEFYTSNLAPIVKFEELSISGFDVYQAVISPDGADDLLLLRNALSGNDKARLSAFRDIANGFTGNDQIQGRGGNDDLFGEDGADTLDGGTGDDNLYGGNADDWLVGGAGADFLGGGEGRDTADYSAATAALTVDLQALGANTGDAAGDTYDDIENVVGGTAGDILSGDGANNLLIGGAGNDTLDGRDGADELVGGAGNDLLASGAGDDLLNGSAGTDTVVFTGAEAVTVNLAILTAQDTGQGMDTFLSIENLTGGDGDDSLTGNGLANRIDGGGGNDTVAGGGGDDRLFGSGGDDTLAADSGNDRLSGGEGIDTILFSGSGAAVVNLALTTAQATGRGLDVVTGIENVTGAAGADRLSGDGLGNILSGLGGNDTLNGRAGEDTLDGGEGNDVLRGGAEDDLLTGGIGADRFVFRAGDAGATVTDFLDGTDLIVIGSGAERFSDLTVTDAGEDAVISFADVTITLTGVDHLLIGSSDFLFT